MTNDAENRTLSDKFMLRLPDGMRDRIKAAAEASNRSMNAEIVGALEEKYPAPTSPSVERMLEFMVFMEAGHDGLRASHDRFRSLIAKAKTPSDAERVALRYWEVTRKFLGAKAGAESIDLAFGVEAEGS